MIKTNIDIEYVLTKLYGQPTKSSGGHNFRQCPICFDSSMDNMVSTPAKNVVKCFAGGVEHSSEIMKQVWSWVKDNNYKPPVNVAKKETQIKKPERSMDELERLSKYQIKCNDDLLKNEKLLKIAEESRGITKDTIKNCGIGYDIKALKWVLPIFKAYESPNVVGFEYRPNINLKKDGLHKEKNSPSCFAGINQYNEKREALVIIEGFMDGYLFYQYLKEQGQEGKFHIITPTMGVGSVLKLMDTLDIYIYKNIWVYLDSDERDENGKSIGIETMQILEALYPVKVKIMTCGCKDFSEHYLTCIKKRSEETEEQPKKPPEPSLQTDTRLLTIITKLESGGRLYRPVKFKTPDQLKQLGDVMHLVNTDKEASYFINSKREFACTWEELKQLASYAKENNSEEIQALMIKKALDGKDLA